MFRKAKEERLEYITKKWFERELAALDAKRMETNKCKPKYKYNTFAEFAKAVYEHGLDDAWNNRYSSADRTTSAILQTVQAVLDTGVKDVLVHTDTYKRGGDVAQRLHDCLRVFGVQCTIRGVRGMSHTGNIRSTVVLTDCKDAVSSVVYYSERGVSSVEWSSDRKGACGKN